MFIKRLFAKKQVIPRTKVELNLDVSNPLNKKVLEHLSRSPKNNKPLISYPDDVQDPYNMQGSHPEVVERVWDQRVGMQTYTKWSDGGDMDTKRDLGEDWVFGSWKSKELEWCKTVYKQLDSLT
jgi:hypothetical protein